MSDSLKLAYVPRSANALGASFYEYALGGTPRDDDSRVVRKTIAEIRDMMSKGMAPNATAEEVESGDAADIALEQISLVSAVLE